MNKEEHIIIHKQLHKALDQLLADWIQVEGLVPFTNRPIRELMEWSYSQTINPKEAKE